MMPLRKVIMSSSINVYAVPPLRLRHAIGSRNQSLIDSVLSHHDDFLASIDDIDDTAAITCADAVPEPDDYPFIGTWPPAAIPPALTALQSLDFTPLPPDLAETFTQIRDWLQAAAAMPETTLIGFLS